MFQIAQISFVWFFFTQSCTNQWLTIPSISGLSALPTFLTTSHGFCDLDCLTLFTLLLLDYRITTLNNSKYIRSFLSIIPSNNLFVTKFSKFFSIFFLKNILSKILFNVFKRVLCSLCLIYITMFSLRIGIQWIESRHSQLRIMSRKWVQVCQTSSSRR